MNETQPSTAVAAAGVGAMQKAQVTLGATGLQLRNIDEMFRFAQAVAGSALAPKDFIQRPESVLVAIQMGMEIGLPPMAALQNIAVINGRPSVWGDAQLAIVRATGELEAFEEAETNNDIEVMFRELCFEEEAPKRKALKIQIAKAQANMKKDADDYGVSCFVRRKGFNEAFSRFTVSDAKTAGLWKKTGPWTNYPSRMLKSRARSFLLRDQFGDALKGMMSREEAGDIIDITAMPSEVPRAEAMPGPSVPAKRAFRVDKSAATTVAEVKTQQAETVGHAQTRTENPEPAKGPEAAGNDGDLGPVEQAQNSETDSQPANVTPMPTEAAKPVGKPEPSSSAASVESQPQNTTSPSATETTGASTATKEEKPPATAKAPFVLPPMKSAPDWLPTLDAAAEAATRGSLTQWLTTEELTSEEFIAWCKGRALLKEGQGIADLTLMKVMNVLKQREIVRGNILKARP